MSAGDYEIHRKHNQRVQGTIVINSTGSYTTGVISGATGSASGAIFVQIIDVQIATGATGVTWNFLDSSGANAIYGPLPMDVAPNSFHKDFGPVGVQLTTGASVQLTTSATGAVGVIAWQGYKKYMGGTSVGNFLASGASGTTP